MESGQLNSLERPASAIVHVRVKAISKGGTLPKVEIYGLPFVFMSHKNSSGKTQLCGLESYLVWKEMSVLDCPNTPKLNLIYVRSFLRHIRARVAIL